MLQLHVRHHRRVDHLVDALGFPLLLLLELLDVRQGIHARASPVRVVTDSRPPRNIRRVLVEPAHSKASPAPHPFFQNTSRYGKP